MATGAPALWLLVETPRVFGLARAIGADHFDPEVRRAPLVRRGPFRWTSNAMYVLGFGAFWAIAFAGRSAAALLAAAFAHAAIRAHWWCTERPDLLRMRRE